MNNTHDKTLVGVKFFVSYKKFFECTGIIFLLDECLPRFLLNKKGLITFAIKCWINIEDSYVFISSLQSALTSYIFYIFVTKYLLKIL